MATSGPNYPSTAADDAATGATAWTGVNNIFVEDSTSAGSVAGTATTMHYLKATGFGFSIPTGSTINGITVEIRRGKSGSTGVADNFVKLIRAGTIETTDKASASLWSGVYTYATYGSSSDLWSAAWTSSDINSATFGVAFSAKKSGGKSNAAPLCDTMRITITYTPASRQGQKFINQSINRSNSF